MVTSFLELAVVLLLGVIAGLLLRFVLAMLAVLASVVGLAWLLGFVSAGELAVALRSLGNFLAVEGISSALLATVVGATFVLGSLGGVLLTSRLRAFDRIAVG